MFFRRTETRSAPAEGEVFQRRAAYDLVETARIKAVTTGPQGIRHVCFRVSTPGLDDLGDQRILAADIFHRCIIPPEHTFPVFFTISSPRKACASAAFLFLSTAGGL